MHHFTPGHKTPPSKSTPKNAGNAWPPAASGPPSSPSLSKLSSLSFKKETAASGGRRRATIHVLAARAEAARTTVRQATKEWYQERREDLARLSVRRTARARLLAARVGIAGLAACGRKVVHRASGVEVHRDPDAPSGWRVNQVWGCDNTACPTCGPRQAEARGRQADAAVDEWLARYGEGTVLLVTNTCFHDSQSNLKELTKILKAAWTAARKTMRRRGGADARGWRAAEVTLGGPNGTHPHLHSLMFFPAAEAADAAAENWNTWFVAAVKRLRKSRRYYTPAYADLEAQDIRRVEAGSGNGSYIAKGGWSAAKELTLSHRKTGAGVSIQEALNRSLREPNGRGPWSDLYCELIEATKGMRWWQSFGELDDETKKVMAEVEGEMEAEAAARREKQAHITTVSPALWAEIVDEPEIIGSLREVLDAIAAEQDLAREVKIKRMREAVLAWAAAWSLDPNDISFPTGADPRTCQRGGCDPPF